MMKIPTLAEQIGHVLKILRETPQPPVSKALGTDAVYVHEIMRLFDEEFHKRYSDLVARDVARDQLMLDMDKQMKIQAEKIVKLKDERKLLRRKLKVRDKDPKIILELIVGRILRGEDEIDSWVRYLLPKVKAAMKKDDDKFNEEGEMI